MSSIDPSNSAPRSRRRLAAWLAFGAVGLATGAVWATGFASAGGASSGRVTSPALARSAPVDQADRLANTVTVDTAVLDFTYEGSWGAIADTNLFTVDLRTHPGTYNVALLLADTHAAHRLVQPADRVPDGPGQRLRGHGLRPGRLRRQRHRS